MTSVVHPADTSGLKRPAQAAHFVEWLIPFTTTNPALTHEHRSPLDGELIAHLPLSDTAEIEQAFATARAAQPAWANLPLTTRREILGRFHDAVLERQMMHTVTRRARRGQRRIARGQGITTGIAISRPGQAGVGVKLVA